MSILLKPSEAAARLGVDVWTLREWHNNGIIEAQHTRGGHARYRDTDIKRLASTYKPGPLNSPLALKVNQTMERIGNEVAAYRVNAAMAQLVPAPKAAPKAAKRKRAKRG